jgi:cobalt/nickel transport system permease protein
MIYVDAIAHQSVLTSWHPKLRITATFLLLLISVMFDQHIIYGLILVGSVGCIIILTRQRLTVLVRILSIPIIFIGVASCLIMFSFTRVLPDLYLLTVPMGNHYLILTPSGVQMAYDVMLRSLSTVCLVFSMTLTLPMSRLIEWMAWLRVPPAFIQLFTLSYRMIFVVFEEAAELLLSQQLRFGFIHPKTSFLSVRQMASMLFMRVLWRMSDMDIAMQIRFYYEK